MSIHACKTFAVLILCCLLAACNKSPAYQPLVPGAVVLAFGDSVTHGTGANDNEDYPTRLAERSGWQVINAGIPGDTAGAARSRLDASLQQHKPALVLIELGGNDFLRRRSENEVKEDLRAIIQTVKKSGATPVLVAVPAFSLISLGGLSDAAIYADLAVEEKVLLIDDVFSKVLSDPALRADPIHPNAAGYQALAEGVGDALRQAGLLTAR